LVQYSPDIPKYVTKSVGAPEVKTPEIPVLGLLSAIAKLSGVPDNQVQD